MNNINLSTKQTYGSITNRITELHCAFPTDFDMKVGFGGTEHMWSDRVPYSVCVVYKNWNNKGFDIVGCQRDKTEWSEQDKKHNFIADINASVRYLKSEIIQTEQGERKVYNPVTWNKKTKRWNKGGVKITLGHRDYYCDPSF